MRVLCRADHWYVRDSSCHGVGFFLVPSWILLVAAIPLTLDGVPQVESSPWLANAFWSMIYVQSGMPQTCLSHPKWNVYSHAGTLNPCRRRRMEAIGSTTREPKHQLPEYGDGERQSRSPLRVKANKMYHSRADRQFPTICKVANIRY